MMLRERFLEDSTWMDAAYSHATPDKSLEVLHGQPHNSLAGFMQNPEASAFDPVFFLHHANVDRHWAIWSAIKPSTYIEPARCPGETFTSPANSIENGTSPLYPFRNDPFGGFHTSQSMRYTRDLGYGYADVPDWQFSDPEELSKHVKEIVANLYPDDTQQIRASRRPWFQLAPASFAENSTVRVANVELASDIQIPLRKWMLELTLEKYFTESSTVFFFFGNPPIDRNDWSIEKNLVLTQSFMPPRTLEAGINPGRVRIPITDALITEAKEKRLQNLEVATIKKFLRAQLKWRVQLQDGSTVDPAKGPQGVKVQILDAEILNLGEGTELPTLGPVTTHYELTWNGV